jgi:hypothetical protein
MSVVIWLMAVITACAKPAHRTELAAKPVNTDTIIGVVQLTGTDSTAPINLMPSSPSGDTFGMPIKLVASPSLRSVNGLRVRLVGTQASDRRWPDRVTVLGFEVIGLKAQPAIDGTLVEDAGALYIVPADGRRRALPQAPPDLRAHVGARVWMAGPLDREPIAYGIIE